jgi:hypothetical protein
MKAEDQYRTQPPDEEDPLLALRGLGKDMWRSLGGGDAFIRWLRSDEPTPPPWESEDGRECPSPPPSEET